MAAKGTNFGMRLGFSHCGCCGGCASMPVSVGDPSVMDPLQQYCCGCVPNQICVSYLCGTDYSSAVFYLQDPGRNFYRGQLYVLGQTVLLDVFFSAVPPNCYIGIKSYALGITGNEPSSLILLTDTIRAWFCPHCDSCAEVAYTPYLSWSIPAPSGAGCSHATIRVALVPTTDLTRLPKCGHCPDHCNDPYAVRGVPYLRDPCNPKGCDCIGCTCVCTCACIQVFKGGVLVCNEIACLCDCAYTTSTGTSIRIVPNIVGETTPAPRTSLSVDADNLLVVESPSSETGAVGWNVYVGTSAGHEQKQNILPIPIDEPWFQPNTGLVAGLPPPTANSAGILAPAANGALSQIAGESVPAANYFVRSTYVAGTGQCELALAGTDSSMNVPLANPAGCTAASAHWLTFDNSVPPPGNSVYTLFSCMQCDGNCNVTAAPGCCDEPLPVILTATLTIAGTGTCCDGSFMTPMGPLGAGGISGWRTAPTSDPTAICICPQGTAVQNCKSTVQLILSCVSPGVWSLQFIALECASTTIYAHTYSTICSPLSLTFTIPLSGITCCGLPPNPYFSGTLTVKVTE